MSRLTRDGTAETVSRDQILRHERGQGDIDFSCSADHEKDWQHYSVDPYSCYSKCVTIQRRKVTQDFSSTFLLRCVPLFFSREGFSHPFPSSTVKSNFMYPRNNRSPLVWLDMRKNPSSCACAEIRIRVTTSEGFEVTD